MRKHVIIICQSFLFQYSTNLQQNASDDTELYITISSSGMDLTASGSLLSVAEVGEVLGWLGDILRTSGAEGVIAYSVPRTEKLTTAALTFNLTFDISSLQQIHDTKISKGTCWHALFNYPVIAKEYPIPKRADEKCLEIPLNYMARLGQAYRATICSSRFVLKGCITMFIPAQRLGNSVLWHFLINQDESRMSYLKVEELGLDKVSSEVIDYSCLDSVRNFLSWSSHVEIQIGK